MIGKNPFGEILDATADLLSDVAVGDGNPKLGADRKQALTPRAMSADQAGNTDQAIPLIAAIQRQLPAIRALKPDTVVKRTVSATSMTAAGAKMDIGGAFGFRNSGTVNVTVRVNQDSPNSNDTQGEVTLKPNERFRGVVNTVHAWVASTAGELTFFKTAETGAESVATSAPSGGTGSTIGAYGSSDGGTAWYPIYASTAGVLRTDTYQGGVAVSASAPLNVKGQPAVDGETEILASTTPGATTATAEFATGITGKQGSVKVKMGGAGDVYVLASGTSGGNFALIGTLSHAAAPRDIAKIALQGWEKFLKLYTVNNVSVQAWSELFAL